MSREIKFRAWDKTHQEWIGAEAWCVRPDGAIVIETFLNGLLDSVTLFQGDDRFILSQYTGLKDKNGVEIYEGDIVRDPDGELRTIYWRSMTSYSPNLDGEAYYTSHEVQVIGNVYEHEITELDAELLK